MPKKRDPREPSEDRAIELESDLKLFVNDIVSQLFRLLATSDHACDNAREPSRRRRGVRAANGRRVG